MSFNVMSQPVELHYMSASFSHEIDAKVFLMPEIHSSLGAGTKQANANFIAEKIQNSSGNVILLVEGIDSLKEVNYLANEQTHMLYGKNLGPIETRGWDIYIPRALGYSEELTVLFESYMSAQNEWYVAATEKFDVENLTRLKQNTEER